MAAIATYRDLVGVSRSTLPIGQGKYRGRYSFIALTTFHVSGGFPKRTCPIRTTLEGQEGMDENPSARIFYSTREKILRLCLALRQTTTVLAGNDCTS